MITCKHDSPAQETFVGNPQKNKLGIQYRSLSFTVNYHIICRTLSWKWKTCHYEENLNIKRTCKQIQLYVLGFWEASDLSYSVHVYLSVYANGFTSIYQPILTGSGSPMLMASRLLIPTGSGPPMLMASHLLIPTDSYLSLDLLSCLFSFYGISTSSVI